MVVQIAFLILHKISPLENALIEMPLRKFVYLFKDLSSTYTVISRIGKFFVSQNMDVLFLCFLNLYRKKQILVLFNFKILVSASVKDKSLNPYTIYLCMYLCKVCDERGEGEGGRGGGVGGGGQCRPLSKSHLLILSRRGRSTNNEQPGNHPNSTKIQHQRTRYHKR